MLRLTEGTKIYVAAKPVDFRKAINGLAVLIVEQFETPVNDGSVYVFYNRDCDRVKCLFWERNGFVLYHKRLERGRFKFGKSDHDYLISHQGFWPQTPEIFGQFLVIPEVFKSNRRYFRIPHRVLNVFMSQIEVLWKNPQKCSF